MGMSPNSGSLSVRADLAKEAVASLFGNANTAPIMRVLLADPAREYSVAHLMRAARLTSNEGVKRAVDALVRAEWVLERREGRERLLRVNDETLTSPADPYVQVPSGFRSVVRYFVDTLLRESGVEIWKVLLFGGLAVGRGDRGSDVDVLVITPSPRPVRLRGQRLADELRLRGHEGDRYRIHLLVESPATLRKRRGDPALASLLRQAVRLWDDPRHRTEDFLPGGG